MRFFIIFIIFYVSIKQNIVRVEMGSRQTSTLRHYFYNIKLKLYYYDRSYSYLNTTEFVVKKPHLRDYLLRLKPNEEKIIL